MLNVAPVALGLLALQVAAKIHSEDLVISNGYHLTADDKAAWAASFQPNGTAFQKPSDMPIIELKPGQTIIMGNSSSKGGPHHKRNGAHQVNVYDNSDCHPGDWLNTLKNFGCGTACFRMSQTGYSAWVYEQNKGKPTPSVALYANDQCSGDYTHADDDGGHDITRCTETQTNGFKSFIANQC